jgi:hypothetical protein
VVDFSISKNFRITERVNAQFRMDAFNLFNHPQYGTLAPGNNPGPNIGFNAPNTPASPEFLDTNGNPTTVLADAVSIRNSPDNSSPNAVTGTVKTASDRNRQFQYSLRFTF